MLAAWALTAWLGLVSPVFLPSPAAVAAKFVSVAVDGFVDSTLLEHLGVSLARVFAALLAALAVGVPVGIAIGASTVGRGIFDPLLEFLRPIPPLAYLPLIIIWFGIGEPSKVLVIAIAMIAPIALSTAAGVKGVSRERVNAARSLGATPAAGTGLCRVAERAALDPHRSAHCARSRLDDAGRGRAHCRHAEVSAS